MRNIPDNYHDFFYLVQKIGLSPLRGLIWLLFLKKGSSLPFIGSMVKIISPSKLKFGSMCFVGRNAYIDAYSISGIEIGNNVTIRENAHIQCRSGLGPAGLGLKVGNNTYIGPNCKIGVGGLIEIGADVQIGFSVAINSESHISHGGSYTTGKVSRVGVRIESSVWIGDGVVILDGVIIGARSTIGAGSVVTKDVLPDSTVAGVPAKKLV